VRTHRRLAVLVGCTALLAAGAGVSSAGGRSPQPAVGAVASSSGPGPVGQAGRWIVDRQGRVVVEHGFNLVDKVAPYEPSVGGFGVSDARFLADHGFNAVRLGVLAEAIEPTPGHFDDAYLRNIRATVALLRSFGIRSLIDFHQDLYNEKFQGEGLPAWMIDDDGLPVVPKAGFPGNYFVMPALQAAFANFWANAKGPGGIGLLTRYVTLVHHVAAFFHGVRGVLGYDVFNEPFPGPEFLPCFPPLGCPEFDASLLRPAMAAMIRAVHSVDPEKLAFFEPWVDFDYGAPTSVGKVATGPVGMSFHDYCLGTLGVPSIPGEQAVCDLAVEERVMANALHQADSFGSALLLTEFGASTDLEDIREVLGLADTHDISWLEWAYCDCGDPTGDGQKEAMVYDTHKAPRGANVDRATLQLLDEPYPQLVSGTPQSSSYDPTSDVFSLTYATTSPDGRRFAAGARTRIYTSPLHYPHGYRVSVSGARVVGDPSSPYLVLAERPGADSVSVQLRPLASADQL
jgi:endoglycosylceramidase